MKLVLTAVTFLLAGAWLGAWQAARVAARDVSALELALTARADSLAAVGARLDSTSAQLDRVSAQLAHTEDSLSHVVARTGRRLAVARHALDSLLMQYASIDTPDTTPADTGTRGAVGPIVRACRAYLVSADSALAACAARSDVRAAERDAALMARDNARAARDSARRETSVADSLTAVRTQQRDDAARRALHQTWAARAGWLVALAALLFK